MQAAWMEFLKVIFLGVIEGVTEWLPISSTGHMLLADQMIALQAGGEFKEVFFVVIQLGAILAVILLYGKKMIPLQYREDHRPVICRERMSLWLKIIVACIPGGISAIFLDDYVDAHFQTPEVIAGALIFYGIVFIMIEIQGRTRVPVVDSVYEITYAKAFLIGLFQILSMIPGTSRSGATIIGALLIGISRVAAAEFTFYLAVPVMTGLSLLKLVRAGTAFSLMEILMLGTGMLTAFLVSVLVIRFLMSYIKKHDFIVFGWYRILLGLAILLLFL